MGSSSNAAIINPHPERLPGPQLLHEFARSPSITNEYAIDFVDSHGSRAQTSYRDLDARSEALAHHLRARFQSAGVADNPRIIVPVFIPQSPALYVSLLAILKAGAGFCPLALDAPHERIKFVLKDVEACVVVTTSEHRSAFPRLNDVSICLADEVPSHPSATIDPYSVHPQGPAYVLYTSGSTGTPKGVILSHLAVTQALLAHDSLIPPFSRFLQFASPTFDVSQFEIWFTFFRGATLIVSDRKRLLNDLPGLLNEMDVDGAEFTPTVAGSLLGSRDQVPRLKVLLTIGEMLTRHVIDEFGYSENEPGLLQGMYGPTEAAIHCTMQPNFQQGAKAGIIGRPFSTVSAFIIATKEDSDDASGELKILSTGEVGELAVGGHQLADGYLNRPEKTDEVFIPTTKYGMIYRTGDKARMLKDGTLECLGRIATGQVKLRGQRVELGEIEHAAATAHGCRVTVASVLNQNLVVFCLVDPGVSADDVKVACQKWLPPYMVPNDLILLQELPQLPSGKIDRKTLERQYLEGAQDGDESDEDVEPTDEEERIALDTLQSVLGKTVPLAPKASRAGIDSLSAIRIASKFREHGYSISAVDVLKVDSARSLANFLRSHVRRKEQLEREHATRNDKLENEILARVAASSQGSVEQVLPCTPLQASMLAETKRDPQAYCNWIEFAFDPALSFKNIRQSFVDLTQRHQILRSGFAPAESLSIGFAQVVWPRSSQPSIEEVDEFRRDFMLPNEVDLLHPLRLQLSRKDGNPTALLQLHHSLYDGWSIDVLLAEWNELLSGDPKSDKPDAQFASVTEYYTSTQDQTASRDYWSSILRGLTPVSFPDLSSSPSKADQIDVLRGTLDMNTTALSSRLPPGCHPQTLFQAAFAFLLGSYTGAKDLTFGTVTSGRTIPVANIEQVIGPCIATLPLRAFLQADESVSLIVSSLAKSNRSFLEHCTLPLAEIKNLAGVEPGVPLFDTLFIWQESWASREMKQTSVTVADSRDYLEFKLVFEVEPRARDIGLTLRYLSSVVPHHHAEVFLRQIAWLTTKMFEDLSKTMVSLLEAAPLDVRISDSRARESYVVDFSSSTPQLALLGAIGEICHVVKGNSTRKGDTVSIGSIGDLARTNKAGRMLADGTVSEASRVTEEYHLGAEEAEAITLALRRLGQVKDAATIAVNDRPVCFWIPKDTTEGDVALLEPTPQLQSIASRLFDQLQVSLPILLLPKILVPVSGLPLPVEVETLQNFVRNASAHTLEAFQSDHLQEREMEEQWSDLELKIANTVTKTVAVEPNQIKQRTSFFALGINSITSISMARRLKLALETDVQASDIVRHPSVARLAAYLEQRRQPTESILDVANIFGQDVKSEISKIVQRRGLELEKLLPCTPLQEAMLSAELTASRSNTYENHTLFDIRADPARLMAAISAMFERHDIFKTCFFSTDDPRHSFAQAVVSGLNHTVNRVKLCSNDVSRYVEDQVQSGIKAVDTGSPPVIVTFLEGVDRKYILLSLHHALYDGQAIEQLLQEVEIVYHDQELNAAVSYEAFLSQSLTLDENKVDKFWNGRLKDFVAAPFPRLGQCESTATSESAVASSVISVGTGELEAFAKKHSSTTLSILQAAWARTLSRIVDEADVCFGNVVSGRTLAIEGLERLVAPCFNTLPVRVNLQESKTDDRLIQSLHATNSKSLEYQFTPLRRIQGHWSGDGEKLFDTLFLLQKPQRKLDQAIWSLEKDIGDMGFPLVFEILPSECGENITVNIHHDTAILDDESSRSLLTMFEEILSDLMVSATEHSLTETSKHLLQRAHAVKQHQTYNHVGLHELGMEIQEKFEGVHDAAVVVTSPTKVIAFVVLGDMADSTGDSTGALSAHITNALQSGDGSVATVVVDEIIKSPSGQPSRQALLSQYRAGLAPDDTTKEDTSLSKEEKAIKDILARFSSAPAQSITPNKTIFQLGLDSINAIQIAKAVRALGFAASADDVLRHPTIRQLASVLKTPNDDSHPRASAFDFAGFEEKFMKQVCVDSHCSADEIETILPCTSAQAGMIAQFRHTDGSAYLNSWTWQLEDGIDVHRLQAAWNAVTQKHAMLRTGFVPIDSADHPFAAVVYKISSSGGHNAVALNRDLNVERLRNATMNDILQASYIPVWRGSITAGPETKQMNFTALHSVYDAEVLSMIFADLFKAYQGLRLDKALDIKPLASVMLLGASDPDGEHKAFWTRTLKDASVCRFPNLTPERVSDRVITTADQECSLSLGQVMSACRSLGVTLQAALQVAYARLLSTYTGDSSVTFGIVLSGRDTDGADDIAFPIAVTLPFFAEVAEKDNSSQLLERAMSFNSDVRKHQFTPLTDIQHWTGNGKTSLFDSLLVYQRSADADEGAPWKLLDEQATVEYPVSLEIKHSGADKLNFSLVFQSDTVPAGHGRLFLRQYDCILRQVLRISRQAEVPRKLLSIFPAKDPLISVDVRYLHEFVERSAEENPKRIALEFNETIGAEANRQTWTYAELDEIGNRVGNCLLRKEDIGPGGLIAICFDKCPEASFATYGILKSGNGFVAIDPGAPIARKKFVVEDSCAKAVVTMSKLAVELRRELDIPVIAMDELDLSLVSPDKPDVETSIDPEAVSYCLYTSGSTGTPKGCLISHSNAVQGLLAFKRIFAGRWTEQSRWLQFASFHFDVSVLEQFWSWMVGITVVSTPRDVLFEDLAGNLGSLNITHLDLTPSLARLITPDDVPSLCGGVFITGGEQLRQEVLDAWGSTGVIHNFYGPSECTIGVTVNPGVRKNGKTSNIGKQFDNVGSYVLKPETYEPVLIGAVGELCVSGPLLGKGYLNREDLTKQRFPFVEAFGEKIYRTGDLVRMLQDGSVDFMGRIDDQVKLRGQRLELGEINNAVKQATSDVKDAHTMVIKDQKRQTEQIVSFVVEADSSEDVDQTEATIWTNCRNKLPPYMVPSRIIWVDGALPLTVNNKVDTKALRGVYDSSAGATTGQPSEGGDAAPLSSQQEHAVARALARCLKSNPGDLLASTNIFQSGLDSILVFNFVRALHAENLDGASTQLVMSSSTIANLASKLASVNGGDDGDVLSAKQSIAACQHQYRSHVAQQLSIDVNEIEVIAPCTPLQQGMAVRAISAVSSHTPYLNVFEYELADSVEVEKLLSAWIRLIKAVPILRTAFAQVDEGFFQCVLKPESQLLGTIFKLRDEATVLQRPLSVTFDQRQHSKTMRLEIFHAIYDAISLDLMLEKLSEHFEEQDHIAHGPSFFDAIPHGPLKRSTGSKEFWQQHLRHAVPKSISAEKGKTAETIAMGATLSQLRKFGDAQKQLQVTHQAVVQTVWTVTLQAYLEAPIAVGMVVSGRNLVFADADQVIGPMFNTIPYRAAFQENDTFKTAAQRCHEFNVQALPHHHASIHDISKWSTRSGEQPLFDSLFVFQKSSLASDRAGMPWKQTSTKAEPDYPLAFEAVQVRDDSLELTLVSAGATLTSNDCEQLLQQFQANMQAVLEDVDKALVDVVGETYSRICMTASGTEPSEAAADREGASYDWSDADKNERSIAESLALIAGIDVSTVTPQTTIFELGLDSIDAIKLSSRLKKTGIDLSVSSIVKVHTVTGMATRALATSSSTKETQQHAQYTQVKKAFQSTLPDWQDRFDDVLPVTPLQEAMVADMLATEYEHYFNYDVLKLAPEVDLKKLYEAWLQVVEANPVLRLGFVEIDEITLDSAFAQVLHDPGVGKHLWLTREAPAKDWDAIHEGHRQLIMSLEATPPVRISVVMAPDEEQYLVLSIAHALYDGFSLGLLHEDLQAAYRGALDLRPGFEPALSKILLSAGEDSQSFWSDFLHGAKPCLVPLKPGRDSSRIHREEVSSNIPASDIERFCKEQRITLQAFGQTCWSLVLASVTSGLDVGFGLVLSGRDDEQLQQIAFPTMNTVAVRSVLHGSRAEMLQYTQSNLADIMQHQHFPLRKIQALSAAQGDKLFNSIFIFQKRPESEQETKPIYESLGGESRLEYPIAVEFEVSHGHLVWRTACNDQYFNAAETEDLLKRLNIVLEQVVTDPDANAVDFNGSKGSICGLPLLELRTLNGNVSKTSGHTNGLAKNHANGHPVTDQEPADAPSEIQEAVRHVLSRLSGVPASDITGDATLFHLGLDSISAIKISSLLRKESLKISVSDMLKAGTVANIASALARQPTSTESKSVAIDRSPITSLLDRFGLPAGLGSYRLQAAEVDELLPATAGQTYMLNMWLNSKGALFYPTFSWFLHGASSSKQVEKAWEQLVAATPILRTVFLPLGQSDLPYVQAILRPEALANAAVKPLASLQATQHAHGVQVSIHIHHAYYDAVSLNLLLGTLARLCSGVIKPSAGPSMAAVVAAAAHSSTKATSKSFWSSYFSDARPRPIANTQHTPRTALYKPALLSHTTTASLSALAREANLPLSALILASAAKSLSATAPSSLVPLQSGQHALPLGLYLSNRTPDTEALLTPTLALLPILVRDPDTQPLVAVAQQAHADIQALTTHDAARTASLHDIQRWTGVRVDVFFNFLRAPDADDDAATPDAVTVVDQNDRLAGEEEAGSTDERTLAELQRLSSAAADVGQAYRPTIDVEAAVRDGQVDVGVFGPAERLGREEAKGVVEGIQRALEAEL